VQLLVQHSPLQGLMCPIHNTLSSHRQTSSVHTLDALQSTELHHGARLTVWRRDAALSIVVHVESVLTMFDEDGSSYYGWGTLQHTRLIIKCCHMFPVLQYVLCYCTSPVSRSGPQKACVRTSFCGRPRPGY